MDTDEAHRTAAAGWEYSARAYIDFQDADDPNRTTLLDPAMLELCGNVRGRRLLDIGCGEGRFCRMLGERGADAVGIDLTPALICAARDRGGATGRTCMARRSGCRSPTPRSTSPSVMSRSSTSSTMPQQSVRARACWHPAGGSSWPTSAS